MAATGQRAGLAACMAALTALAGANSIGRAQAALGGGGTATLAAAAVVVPTTAAGRTPTEFGVSQSGAATYRIPLWTPPGVGDVELDLALVYSSRGGGNALGVGWSLQGLSAIARCNRTYAQDGVAAGVSNTLNDRYCLDGQPLRLVSGTAGMAGAVYATAIESFTRIVANGSAGNGPESFTATSRSGLVYEYGGTADSRVYAGNTSTVRTWSVSRVRDRVGNAITLSYQNEAQPGAYTNGTQRIAAITYPTTATGVGPFYRVDFAYSLRPATDVTSGFLAGNIAREPYQLDRITTQATDGSAPIKSYALTYENAPVSGRLRLASVQECGASTCLQPTSIRYQDGVGGWAPMVETGVSPSNAKAPVPLDLNGDGMQDILYPVGAGNGKLSWRVLPGAATGFGVPFDTGLITSSPHTIIPGAFAGNGRTQFLVQQAGYWHVAGYNSAGTFTSVNTGLVPSGEYGAADFDGDGLADLMGLSIDSTNTFFVRRNTSTPSAGGIGATFAATSMAVWTLPAMRNSVLWDNLRVADLNGDGRADLVILTYSPSDRNSRFFATTFLSNGFGTSFTYGSEWMIEQNSMVTMGDWNADGCSDIVQWNEVYLSNCAGSFARIVTNATFAMGVDIATVVPADWNGDGRSDLLYIDAATKNWFVVRSTGEGAAAPIDTGIKAPLATRWFDLDANGDGLTDLAYLDGLNGNKLRFHAHAGTGQPPDLATGFTDGFGITHTPSYASISRSNYTRRADATFPAIDFAGPLYVVSAFAATDGVGGTYQAQYAYEGARVHVQGRGFQGFAQQRIVDSRLGVVVVDDFARDYPYTGMHLQRTVFQSNGTTRMQQWTAQTAVQSFGVAGVEQRQFPFVASTTEKQYEVGGTLNGVLTAETSRTYTYGDGYGNVTALQSTTWDRDPVSPWFNQAWRSTASLGYANDANQWCIGLPTSASITSTAPGQAAMTRTAAYAADTVTCRITQETLEPNQPALRQITSYAFDACGNLATLSITGARPDGTVLPARVTRFNYGSRCQFLESSTNAAGETTSYAWNTSFGVPTRLTDANTLATTWTIDEFGRRIAEQSPDGTRVTHAFQSCATAACWPTNDRRFVTFTRYLAADGSLIREQHTYLDGYERERVVEFNGALGAWLRQTTDYDAAGRPIRESLPYGSAPIGHTARTYDAMGRLTSQRQADATGATVSAVSLAYSGRTVNLTDALNRTHARVVDVTGLLRRVTDPAPGGVTRYDYDSHGNLARIEDAGGAVSSGAYDVRGQRTLWSDAGTGTSAYSYNSLGELVAWRDAKGQAFGAGYDALGRLTSMTAPDGASSWTWGTSSTARNVGRLVAKSGFGYSESRSYDTLGRLGNRRITTDQNYDYDYAYNNQGALDTLTYPSSPVPTGQAGTRFKVRYSYAWGTPIQIDDVTQAQPRSLWRLNAVNELDAPTSESLASNAIARTSTYDLAAQRLLGLQAGVAGSGSNRQNLAYQWDSAGNLLSRRDANQGLTESFTYDGLDRVTGASLNGTTTLAMSYTAAGNVAQKSDVGTYAYTDTARPNAVTAAGGETFTYDANGNLATRGGLAQQWNSANQPTLLRKAGFQSQFAYGPDRQRWRQVATYQNGTETTHYVGGLLEKEAATSTGVTYWRHYVVTPGGSTVVVSRNSNGSSSTTYALTDHLGSSDVLLDDTGAMVGKQSFGATGSRRGSDWTSASAPDWLAIANSTRQGYTGHEMLDNLTLVHMNGRVYDPQLARFLSADPLIGNLADSQSVNPYAYVGNRPLNATDSTGLIVDGGASVLVAKFMIDSMLPWIMHAIFGGHDSLPPPPATALPGQSAQSGVSMCGVGTFSGHCSSKVNYAAAPPTGRSGQTSTWGATSVEDEYARENLERFFIDLGVNTFEVLVMQPVRNGQAAYDAAERGEVVTAVVLSALTVCAFVKPCQGWLSPAKALRRLGKLFGNRGTRQVELQVIDGRPTTVIGKLGDLKDLKEGTRSLLDRLPNRGNPKANWQQNAGVLREEMSRGQPIRDMSVDSSGKLINNTGFLRAERNLLESKGWKYDPATRQWNPPAP